MSTEISPRPLSDSAALKVWESNRRAAPSARAWAILRAALPEPAQEAFTNWCLGESDAFFLQLQRAMFGSRLECTATCPACAGALELNLEIENLLTAHGSGAAQYHLKHEKSGRVIFFRLPNHGDLQALSWDTNPAKLRELLIERCVLYAEQEGERIAPVTLSDDLIMAMNEAMSAADPQAEILLNLTCPICSHAWQTRFDITDFLWREISNRSRQLLSDIHHLAQAYGWTESEILALSEARRRMYLELISA